MSAPCPACLQIECPDQPDTGLYSIQSATFPFIIDCPPGFDCTGATSFNILCCNQLLSGVFPPGSGVADKLAIIQNLVNQCNQITNFCGQVLPPGLFYNEPETCSAKCLDGTNYVFTVPAGTFAAGTQDLANSQAQAYACQQASARLICLGNIPSCICKGSPYSAQIPETGGVGPFLWSVVAGALPTGLLLDPNSGTISGNPTTAGVFVFTVRITSQADQSYNQKQFSMTVLSITTTSLPPFTIGVPYSFQLKVTGGSGNYAWKIVSGSLPPGLSISPTGLISGTPT